MRSGYLASLLVYIRFIQVMHFLKEFLVARGYVVYVKKNLTPETRNETNLALPPT